MKRASAHPTAPDLPDTLDRTARPPSPPTAMTHALDRAPSTSPQLTAVRGEIVHFLADPEHTTRARSSTSPTAC